MRRIAIMMGTVFLVALLAPSVSAQGVLDPLLEHVDKKAQEVQDDPVAFATDHASEEGLERESDWTMDYACFAAREAAKEAGAPPPELPVCPAFEDVNEAEEDDAVIAEAEELDEVLAEADALVDDALGTVDRILDDPGNALDEILAFLDRTLAAVGRILADVLAAVGGAIGASFSALWDGLAWVTLTPIEGTVDGVMLLADGIAVAAGATASGVSAAWQATTGAVADAAGAVADATTGAMDSVREAVASLFGGAESPVVEDRVRAEPTRDVAREADGLVDTVARLVEL